MGTTTSRDFARALERDVAKMIEQVRAYPDEESLWRTAGSIKNGAGTLALHVAGNLDHFVWASLGGGAYARDRDLEFSERAVPRDEVVARLETCRQRVVRTLEGLDEARLSEPFPAPLPAHLQGTVHWFLVHLVAHTNWHLGQMDYHRRLVAEGSE
jgi:uncharacterized damage-inducible protein DinB